MTRIPATVRKITGAVQNERAPMVVTEAADLAILDLLATAWFPGEAAGMEGVADGSVLPLRWRSLIDRQALKPSVAAVPPGYGYDAAIGKGFLRFGFGNNVLGNALSRRTLTLATGRLVSGGSGYVNGEIITFQNGVKIRNDTVASGAIVSFTITDFGTFSSNPTAILTQTSTTGSGTGATFLPEMRATTCGALEINPNPAIVPATLPFSVVAVFRCPLVATAADSGGVIFGNQLGESEIFSANANTRWSGLKVGGGSTFDPGRLMAHWQGDLTNQFNGPTGVDYRDGQWHVAIMTFKGSAGGTTDSGTLWVDNVKQFGVTGFTALSTIEGARRLRIGAAGLPASGPCAGFCGDVAELLLVPVDLNANSTARATIMDRLMAEYRP